MGFKLPNPEAIKWARDMGAIPTKLMVHALVQVAMTFPVGTGLGWDGIHPRAICLVSEATLECLVAVIYIYHCEVAREWSTAVDIVVIALLPKSDGAQTDRPHAVYCSPLVSSQEGSENPVGEAQPSFLPVCGERDVG